MSISIRLVAVTCLASVLVSSCATTKYYPICIYGRTPFIKTYGELHRSLGSFISASTSESATFEFSPNDRLVVVKAMAGQHKRLAAAWPRVACLGPGGIDDDYKDYRQCIDLVEKAVASNGLTPLGENSDGIGDSIIFCGTELKNDDGANTIN